ncbi:MAG: glycerate kinase family protein [Ginsengibacter sp.]
MHILIAPNSFKNSLDATLAANMIRKGLSMSRLNFTCECFPIGDGGGGTGNLLTRRSGGSFEKVWVQNPAGKKITATFGLTGSKKTAIIEMAEASGLHLLSSRELNPLMTSSYGTGQLIREALNRGVDKILITMGGSATVDGGTGILRALGIRFLDAAGRELPQSVDALEDLNSIDLSEMDTRIKKCQLVVLCDVENKLLGKQGAANVFGPQKGATPEQVKKLNIALNRLAQVILKETMTDISSIKHGGTAGGAAAGLHGILNAELVNGIEYFLNFTGFESSLKKSDLVITGEGSIDLQTLKGKGPYGIARRAKKRGLPVIALAGKVPLAQNISLEKYFDVLMAIQNEPMKLPLSIQLASQNLVRVSHQVGSLLALLGS